jgi:hypothetical protein
MPAPRARRSTPVDPVLRGPARRAARGALGLAVAGWVALGAGCRRGEPERHLDLALIEVSPDAQLRTDTVGEGAFAGRATFVLVDAANRGAEGAYVTLGGELATAAGVAAGALKPQSLWVPAGESRTFALVDAERAVRAEAAAARVEVRGALASAAPPPARIEELHRFEDGGRIVLQAYLVNGADRPGRVVVIGAFHGADARPLTRPFEVIAVGAHAREVVRFIGPPGAQRGAIFIGDAVY